MGQRNYLTKSKTNWKLSTWRDQCPEFTFKTVCQEQLPDFLPENLSKKYNSGYFASSGTTIINNDQQSYFYIGFFVGLRIDRDFLDEQVYVSVYDKQTDALIFGGYLQHGSYDDRTTPLDNEQIQLINSSGITVNIHTNRLPKISQGPLRYLDENKLITGLEVSAIKAMESIYPK